MKKLLLLTNSIYVCFLFISCQNSQKQKAETNIESKVVIKGSVIDTDTAKRVSQSAKVVVIGNDKSIKKDTANEIIKTTPIIHKAPEQDKIDSIKNAKTKNKKPIKNSR